MTKYVIYADEFESRGQEWPEQYTLKEAYDYETARAGWTEPEELETFDSLEELKEAIKNYSNCATCMSGVVGGYYLCTIFYAEVDELDDDGDIISGDIVEFAPDMPSYINYYGRREWCGEVKGYTINHSRWSGTGWSYSEPVQVFKSSPYDSDLVSADALGEFAENWTIDDPENDYTGDRFDIVDDTNKAIYTYYVK